MKAMISARNVTFLAGSATLLRDISLSVAGGETVALVGPNGAGKSTLLKILSGELQPARGEVLVKEKRTSSYHPRELASHRVVLAQSITLTFPFTVEEIVWMGAGDRRTAAVGLAVEDALHVSTSRPLGPSA